MQDILRFIRLCSLLLLVSFYSKADVCLPDIEGLCTPGVTVTEETQVDVTEEDLGTEIVTTTTTTVTTTTTTVTNEDSGDILDSSNGYVGSHDDGNMQTDWGGQGPASMPTGNTCGELGADRCAQITGSGNSTSTMGVSGMGTTFIINNINISDLQIDKGGEDRYSIEVDKRDAQDRIYMHITGRNGSNTVFQGTDILSESGIASGYQSYNGSFDFSGVLNRITVEVGGRDINLAIGPLFDDVTVNVFYNVINTIITQQITTLEEIYYLNLFDPTELEFVEEVFEFNDISFDDGDIDFTPIEAPTEEVTYETVELEIQEFEIDLPQPEIASVEVQAEMELELELEMEMEIDLPEPEIEETIEVAQVEETVDEGPAEEETTEPDSETTEESPVEPEDSSEQEEVQQEEVEEPEKPVKEPSAKEKAATKIVKKIDDKARYDESNQMKTLIVMQILGNTKTFFDTQSTIQDTNVSEYLNKTLEDNYGILFDMAQGQIMEDMINAQY